MDEFGQIVILAPRGQDGLKITCNQVFKSSASLSKMVITSFTHHTSSFFLCSHRHILSLSSA